jgi:hypothetical protein
MLSRFPLRGGQLFYGARAREAPAPLTVPPSTRRETSRGAETRAGLLERFPPFPKYFIIQVSPNDLSVATHCVYATAIVAAPRVFDPVPLDTLFDQSLTKGLAARQSEAGHNDFRPSGTLAESGCESAKSSPWQLSPVRTPRERLSFKRHLRHEQAPESAGSLRPRFSGLRSPSLGLHPS